MIYLDTNAIKFLWDKYVNIYPEGDSKTKGPINPFKNVLLSEYNIDELTNIEINTKKGLNELKRNLCFLTIFLQDIPIIYSITKIVENSSDSINHNYLDFLVDKTIVNGHIIQRLIEVNTGKISNTTNEVLKKKKNARKAWQLYQINPQTQETAYCPLNQRKSLEEITKDILRELNCNSPLTLEKFYLLCMKLYVAKRQRKISIPLGMTAKKFYKSNKDTFSEHIDFYHISYLLFVKTFVTNDRATKYIIEILNKLRIVDCIVLPAQDYLKQCIKEALLAK